MDELAKYRIPYYYSHSPKTEFVQRRISNISFGFLGVDFKNHFSFNQQSLDKTLDLIRKYNSKVDWLVLSVHWGDEYATSQSKTQREYAQAFIDAGADVIHGHHSHVLQPYEWYRNKLIFYSLGNFVFDQDFSENTRTSAVYKVTFTKDKISKIHEYKTEIPKNGRVKVTSSSYIYGDKSSVGGMDKTK
jgi:poly-gamma-glutamate capsule biosynthesis protein CapA/YwtB (metallophosphatase superfamily)